LKKRTKKLLLLGAFEPPCRLGRFAKTATVVQAPAVAKVFLVLFLQKKNTLLSLHQIEIALPAAG
jgi:hypothetical protein